MLGAVSGLRRHRDEDLGELLQARFPKVAATQGQPFPRQNAHGRLLADHARQAAAAAAPFAQQLAATVDLKKHAGNRHRYGRQDCRFEDELLCRG